MSLQASNFRDILKFLDRESNQSISSVSHWKGYLVKTGSWEPLIESRPMTSVKSVKPTALRRCVTVENHGGREPFPRSAVWNTVTKSLSLS